MQADKTCLESAERIAKLVAAPFTALLNASAKAFWKDVAEKLRDHPKGND